MVKQFLDVTMVDISKHLIYETVEWFSKVKVDVQQEVDEVMKIFQYFLAKFNMLAVSI